MYVRAVLKWDYRINGLPQSYTQLHNHMLNVRLFHIKQRLVSILNPGLIPEHLHLNLQFLLLCNNTRLVQQSNIKSLYFQDTVITHTGSKTYLHGNTSLLLRIYCAYSAHYIANPYICWCINPFCSNSCCEMMQ